MFGKLVVLIASIIFSVQGHKHYERPDCPLRLPFKTDEKCKIMSDTHVGYARHWYKITNSKDERKTEFPLKNIAWLNQPVSSVGFKVLVDEFESRWFAAFQAFKSATDAIKKGLATAFSGLPMRTYEEYKLVYETFNHGVKSLKVPHYFDNPANHDDFTDVMKDEVWTTDKAFVQRRLAGTCPFMLRKVTTEGSIGIAESKLLSLLNPNHDFDADLTEACQKPMTLEKAIEDEKLFVLYHEEHNDLESVPDKLDMNPNDNRKMIKTTSPISLFVVDEDDVLKIAAIQWDYKPDSPVYNPKSTKFEWQLAKSMADLSDMDICQSMYHLSDIHFSYSIHCVIFHRHFGPFHPLYNVFKYHCEGTVPHIALTYKALAYPEDIGHLLFTMGHSGFVKMASKAYEQHYYQKLNFDHLMKSRGLDDSKFSYYPFREDGEEIWEGLKKFAEELTKYAYKGDKDVEKDVQLQAFANEMSNDGRSGDEGGHGKFKGFPTKFEKKKDVEEMLLQFLWYTVIHATVNYPATPYIAFPPLTPTKLYDDESKKPNEKHMAESLPDSLNTIGITSFAGILGNFRINRIFDYYKKLQDPELQMIVYEAYQHFHGDIQKTLSEKNKERKENDDATYQYLEPKWLPNSVCI